MSTNTNQETLTKAIEKAIANGWEVGKQICYSKEFGWNQYSGGGIEVTSTGLKGSDKLLVDEKFIERMRIHE